MALTAFNIDPIKQPTNTAIGTGAWEEVFPVNALGRTHVYLKNADATNYVELALDIDGDLNVGGNAIILDRIVAGGAYDKPAGRGLPRGRLIAKANAAEINLIGYELA